MSHVSPKSTCLLLKYYMVKNLSDQLVLFQVAFLSTDVDSFAKFNIANSARFRNFGLNWT